MFLCHEGVRTPEGSTGHPRPLEFGTHQSVIKICFTLNSNKKKSFCSEPLQNVTNLEINKLIGCFQLRDSKLVYFMMSTS